ncbi:hypothetical protein ACOMHN_025794 [Nucella lapillus]
MPDTCGRAVILQATCTRCGVPCSVWSLGAAPRLVLVRWDQKSLVVKSSSGEHTVSLGCEPFGLAQLPSGLVAVTCPGTPAVLLVNLDSGDHQIQHIPTEKEYYCVAAHPVDDTLIVGTWSDTVDVITLQGQVVRTLAHRRHLSLGNIRSLTVAREHLLVTGDKGRQIRRIPLSDSSQPLVETLPGIFPSYPVDTAVDKACNVFVVLRDGGVVMRTTGGAARPPLPGQGGGEACRRCRIALQDDRVVGRHAGGVVSLFRMTGWWGGMQEVSYRSSG